MTSQASDFDTTTILIIDDTVDTVELLRKRLQADGYKTAEAYDGEEGLHKVHEVDPDLIVLDVMMPKIDGYEVCRKLKDDETTRHIPILMLTARNEVPDKVKGLDLGADGYITKPFDYKEVSARVRSLLHKKMETMRLAEKEKLFALDHLVDEVSHEVRNPLVAIGGLARRLQKDLPPEKIKQYAHTILKNTESLEKVVEHLVSLKGAVINYPEKTNINQLIQQLLNSFQKKIQVNRIQLNVDLAEHPPLLWADEENLSKALSHIIDNSIEAVADNKDRWISLSTRLADGYFEILIEDNGKGIPKEKIKNIYDPFFTSKTYGPGLGLTFALKTIQNHKGLISVSSKLGAGTVFTVRLPVTGNRRHYHVQREV